MLEAILKNVLMLSVAGGIIALAILIIRALFWRKIPARLQYAVWALLIIRLVLPVAPSSPISIFSLNIPSSASAATSAAASGTAASKSTETQASGAQHSIIAVQTAPQTDVNSDTSGNASAKSTAQPATQVITFGFNFETAAIVWIFGVAAMLLYFLIVNLAVRISLLRRASCHDRTIMAALDDCRSRLGLRKPVRVVCDSRAKSPAVFGVFRPQIVISSSIAAEADTNQLRYILMHELTHIKRHDNAVNLVIMLLLAVNWFNPVLWYAFSKMKDDCEISCDASVLAALDDDERRAYGYAIVNVLQAMPTRLIPGTAGFSSNFSKRRIVMIANNKKAPIIWAALALVVTMLVGCASLPARDKKAPASSSKQTASQTVSSSKASNDWIYYVNNNANLKIYRRHADGSGAMKVTNVQSACPTVVGDWIYYSNMSDGQRIYKIHGDGTGNKMVSSVSPCTGLTYSGGYLYFCTEFTDDNSDSGKLYRMKPDGYGEEKVCNDYVGSAVIDGGNIYYTNAHDNHLYKINTDGKDKVKISSDNFADDFYISGKMIYYIDHVNNDLLGKIYKIHLDGTGRTAVGTDKAQQIALSDGKIYYYTNDTTLFKMNTDGTGKTKVKHLSWEETRAFGHVNMSR